MMHLVLLTAMACTSSLERGSGGDPGVLGDASRAAGVEARAVRDAGDSSSRVEVQLADGRVLVMADRGNPDRVALSPDGGHVAWVSGVTGLASVWIARVSEGADPRQLTNVGLEDLPRSPGAAPPGWTPPPHLGPPSFDGDRLVWESPDGPVQVVWR